MSTPQVHTFGVAKYVYASAYDKLEADNAKLYRVYDLQAGKIKELEADIAELRGKVTLLERDLILARGRIDLKWLCTDEKEGGGA